MVSSSFLRLLPLLSVALGALAPLGAYQLPLCQLVNQTVSVEKKGCPGCHPVETTICSGHCITMGSPAAQQGGAEGVHLPGAAVPAAGAAGLRARGGPRGPLPRRTQLLLLPLLHGDLRLHGGEPAARLLHQHLPQLLLTHLNYY
ncbi:lutropin subunit beta isoform X2 [Gadus macrocephalus]|uniref:lutropin subunit beta isoform X2 n=1 Tax=Gadus macrocephalus TaxID=80720 RepID=UPI0028CBB397|nr:lutropin subunit beta isoform X2 [Gadus macrocephalus]